MKPTRLTARWTGRAPRRGEWLKAERGRTAYEITAVRRINGTGGARRYRYVLTCARHAPSDIPEGATVHAWTWDKRERRR